MNPENKKEGMGKLKELAWDIRICMMATGLFKEPFSAVPMTTKKIDSNGDIWFLSREDSEHNRNIKVDNKTELLYSDPTKMEFLSVSGKSEIINEKNKLKELYDEEADSWLEGPDDPRLTAIKFTPEKAHYWDTQTNKYEALYHLGIATIAGEEKHSGEEGDLDLNH
ncbi:MAG TPA: pyridoxamine 5'-phosphate oxidase family protein [Flavobacteriaceae bacterium]|nr:pyridoxamine 5'-phosphate oxidase family protein [Flavobacteriaceae bacterium]